jgi:hypothetical protein
MTKLGVSGESPAGEARGKAEYDCARGGLRGRSLYFGDGWRTALQIASGGPEEFLLTSNGMGQFMMAYFRIEHVGKRSLTVFDELLAAL